MMFIIPVSLIMLAVFMLSLLYSANCLDIDQNALARAMYRNTYNTSTVLVPTNKHFRPDDAHVFLTLSKEKCGKQSFHSQ